MAVEKRYTIIQWNLLQKTTSIQRPTCIQRLHLSSVTTFSISLQWCFKNILLYIYNIWCILLGTHIYWDSRFMLYYFRQVACIMSVCAREHYQRYLCTSLYYISAAQLFSSLISTREFNSMMVAIIWYKSHMYLLINDMNDNTGSLKRAQQRIMNA